MVPQYSPTGVELVRSAEETQALMHARRETLEIAVRRVYGPDGLPVQWRHGWKAFVRPLRRSRDGHLLAKVVVTLEGTGVVLERNVRLVKKNPLPYSVGSELSERE
jgi:hypothetical protein